MFQHELKEDALWKRLILKFVGPALVLSVCLGPTTIGLGDILAMIFGGGAVALGMLVAFALRQSNDGRYGITEPAQALEADVPSKSVVVSVETN
jgi:hypothetical protein